MRGLPFFPCGCHCPILHSTALVRVSNPIPFCICLARQFTTEDAFLHLSRETIRAKGVCSICLALGTSVPPQERGIVQVRDQSRPIELPPPCPHAGSPSCPSPLLLRVAVPPGRWPVPPAWIRGHAGFRLPWSCRPGRPCACQCPLASSPFCVIFRAFGSSVEFRTQGCPAPEGSQAARKGWRRAGSLKELPGLVKLAGGKERRI